MEIGRIKLDFYYMRTCVSFITVKTATNKVNATLQHETLNIYKSTTEKFSDSFSEVLNPLGDSAQEDYTVYVCVLE